MQAQIVTQAKVDSPHQKILVCKSSSLSNLQKEIKPTGEKVEEYKNGKHHLLANSQCNQGK